MESKKYGLSAKDPKFCSNVAAEEFLKGLLERGLFFRAKKVVLKKKNKSKIEIEKRKDKDVTKSPKSSSLKKKDEITTHDDATQDIETIIDEESDLKKGNDQVYIFYLVTISKCFIKLIF